MGVAVRSGPGDGRCLAVFVPHRSALRGSLRWGVECGSGDGVAGGQGGYVGVGEEVRAGWVGCDVVGAGDEEFAGGVEGVGVPSGGEHSLPEYEVDVAAFADS